MRLLNTSHTCQMGWNFVESHHISTSPLQKNCPSPDCSFWYSLKKTIMPCSNRHPVLLTLKIKINKMLIYHHYKKKKPTTNPIPNLLLKFALNYLSVFYLSLLFQWIADIFCLGCLFLTIPITSVFAVKGIALIAFVPVKLTFLNGFFMPIFHYSSGKTAERTACFVWD